MKRIDYLKVGQLWRTKDGRLCYIAAEKDPGFFQALFARPEAKNPRDWRHGEEYWNYSQDSVFAPWTYHTKDGVQTNRTLDVCVADDLTLAGGLNIIEGAAPIPIRTGQIRKNKSHQHRLITGTDPRHVYVCRPGEPFEAAAGIVYDISQKAALERLPTVDCLLHVEADELQREPNPQGDIMKLRFDPAKVKDIFALGNPGQQPGDGGNAPKDPGDAPKGEPAPAKFDLGPARADSPSLGRLVRLRNGGTVKVDRLNIQDGKVADTYPFIVKHVSGDLIDHSVAWSVTRDGREYYEASDRALDLVAWADEGDQPKPAPGEQGQEGEKGQDAKADGPLEAVVRGIAQQEDAKIMAKLEPQIRRIAAESGGAVKELVIKTPDGVELAKIETPHPKFADLLAVVRADVPAWLRGPAGSGKTHAADQVAKALKLAFHPMSVCQQTGLHHIMGFKDAAGHFHETPFTKAFRDGGVFLVDEVDRGNPNVLLALNSALANGFCTFGSGEQVQRHANFRTIACANTFGMGPNAEYVGACKIDAATLNRFAYIDWPYDEALEKTLTGNHGLCKQLHKMRAKAAASGLRVIISTRTILNAVKLTAAIEDQTKIIRMVLGAVTDEHYAQLAG